MIWKIEFKLIYAKEIGRQIFHKSTHKNGIWHKSRYNAYTETAIYFASIEIFKRKQIIF